MMRTTSFILLLLLPMISLCQEFNLSGKFSGEAADQIVLKYVDIEGNRINDTLQIQDKKFQTSGEIKGVQRVYIVGNTQSNGMEDPNLGFFFMEPGDIEINLEENHFKDLKVIGSNSENEYKKIESKTKPIRIELDSIAKNRSESSQDLLISGNNKIQTIELNYAIKNPESKLSPYFLSYYQRSIPLDSLESIYNTFPIENRNSIYGKNTYNLIRKNIVKADDIAPNFTAKDIKGNSISLADFKGKYLLIDFWADWCKPCIAKFPEVKSLIEKYKDQDFEVLFVSFDKTEEDWKKGVKKHNIEKWDHTYIPLENLRNPESISYKYDIQPIPAYILINKNGKIVDRYNGASKSDKNFNDLVNKLKELMN